MSFNETCESYYEFAVKPFLIIRALEDQLAGCGFKKNMKFTFGQQVYFYSHSKKEKRHIFVGKYPFNEKEAREFINYIPKIQDVIQEHMESLMSNSPE